MGAHTEYGGYVIDYRKVRHFNCPDLKDFRVRLTVLLFRDSSQTPQFDVEHWLRPAFISGTNADRCAVNSIRYKANGTHKAYDNKKRWLDL